MDKYVEKRKSRQIILGTNIFREIALICYDKTLVIT